MSAGYMRHNHFFPLFFRSLSLSAICNKII